MSEIDAYLRELEQRLRVRGRARTRILDECRAHLTDAASEHGDRVAVRRFGPARELATAFDTEIAARRADRCTAASAIAVLATAGSTLAVVNGAGATAAAVPGWAVTFFAAMQLAGLCTVLAVLLALQLRAAAPDAADVALLTRRTAWALGSAALTLLAAAAAITGGSSPVAVLAGPVLIVLAAVPVLRTCLLARRLNTDHARTVRPPLPHLGPRGLLASTAVVATVAAFVWDHADHDTVGSALRASMIELALVVVGFVALGPTLGLRPAHGRSNGRPARASR